MAGASSNPAATVQHAVETGTPVSRLHAFASYDVADFPVPTGREEEWRFTPLRRLRGLHQGEAHPAAAARVVTEADAPPEVRVETVGRDDPRIGRVYTPADRVSALAYGSFSQATVITVPKEAVASRPTLLSVYGKQEAGDGAAEGAAAEFGHLLVEVQPFAQAVLVLDHQGSATYADNVEFSVGDGASLSVVSVQDWADDAVHLSHHHARLGRDARFKHVAVTLGGDVVRMVPSVRYDGPGGDAEMFGVFFIDAGQHLEHRLFVDHAVHSCRSRVSYKGALQGEDAHGVWIGDVMIRPEAEKTDTYEYNRNLVLTDGTRMDSVPNLEILTGEVIGAGHASASGRLEDHHLFYLMARGIPYQEARRLVIRGFFGELIDRIEVPEVRSRVAEAVEAELERSA
jgi:Fe-S cluster assembly protein SufD